MDAIATPQPPPTPGRGSVVDDLVTLLHARRDFGRKKYGTELQPFNSRDAYVDALQELIDLFQYLHQAQMERAQLDRDLQAMTTALRLVEAHRDVALRERDSARAELALLRAHG